MNEYIIVLCNCVVIIFGILVQLVEIEILQQKFFGGVPSLS